MTTCQGGKFLSMPLRYLDLEVVVGSLSIAVYEVQAFDPFRLCMALVETFGGSTYYRCCCCCCIQVTHHRARRVLLTANLWTQRNTGVSVYLSHGEGGD